MTILPVTDACMGSESMIERELGELASQEGPGTRIKVMQCGPAGAQPWIELWFQREIEGLGWQTHRRIPLAAGQLQRFEDLLSLADADARRAPTLRLVG